MAESVSLAGRCHCGNIEVALETKKPPAEITTRACACSFCRRHGARSISDPEGRARIIVTDPARLNRYRFAHRTADFYVCGKCGVYAAAVLSDDDGAWAILNVNTFLTADAFPHSPAPVNYDHESEAERRRRRKANWTPVSELRLGRTIVTPPST